jgi:hypothetical protein
MPWAGFGYWALGLFFFKEIHIMAKAREAARMARRSVIRTRQIAAALESAAFRHSTAPAPAATFRGFP